MDELEKETELSFMSLESTYNKLYNSRDDRGKKLMDEGRMLGHAEMLHFIFRELKKLSKNTQLKILVYSASIISRQQEKFNKIHGDGMK